MATSTSLRLMSQIYAQRQTKCRNMRGSTSPGLRERGRYTVAASESTCTRQPQALLTTLTHIFTILRIFYSLGEACGGRHSILNRTFATLHDRQGRNASCDHD